MEGWGQHRGWVLDRGRGWGHDEGWSQGVGRTGLGRGAGPAQRPCTHPIEAAQVLDPVLVPVVVVVDDSMLLVHTAGLGRHRNPRAAVRARRPRRWRHPAGGPAPHSPTLPHPTTIPPPGPWPRSPRGPTHASTPQAHVPQKAHPGLTRPAVLATEQATGFLLPQPATRAPPVVISPPRHQEASAPCHPSHCSRVSVGGAGNARKIWDTLFTPKGRAGWPGAAGSKGYGCSGGARPRPAWPTAHTSRSDGHVHTRVTCLRPHCLLLACTGSHVLSTPSTQMPQAREHVQVAPPRALPALPWPPADPGPLPKDRHPAPSHSQAGGPQPLHSRDTEAGTGPQGHILLDQAPPARAALPSQGAGGLDTERITTAQPAAHTSLLEVPCVWVAAASLPHHLRSPGLGQPQETPAGPANRGVLGPSPGQMTVPARQGSHETPRTPTSGVCHGNDETHTLTPHRLGQAGRPLGGYPST